MEKLKINLFKALIAHYIVLGFLLIVIAMHSFINPSTYIINYVLIFNGLTIFGIGIYLKLNIKKLLKDID